MAIAHHIGFGTSGLRGPATGFSPALVDAYVRAFLDVCCGEVAERTVAIGADLRSSSPLIAALVSAAVKRVGWQAIYCGVLPTPALANYSLKANIPAIMVTGSHIPEDYNGLKFYRPDGELLKADEAPMRKAAEAALGSIAAPIRAGVLDEVQPDALAAYVARFTDSFAPDALAGLRIGVFTHSAAGRDTVVAILERLGAQCVPFGRREHFVAVDTEAVATEHMNEMRDVLQAHGLDAIVSTDGDGDRPLLLDDTGAQINGDVLGALTAHYLGARTVVTPLTSTSAVERSEWFQTIIRTAVGSPYVVAAMADAGESVVGFEANGGFLVGSGFELTHGKLAPLATRDAMLPILCVLAAARTDQVTVSALVARLPARIMTADRLKNVAPEQGHAFVVAMAQSQDQRAGLDPILTMPEAIDTTDGTRLTLGDGAIVHFRQSGNAPELRCYVETDAAETTDALLARMMARLADHFGLREKDQ